MTVNLALAGAALVFGTGYLYGQAEDTGRVSAPPPVQVATMRPVLVESYSVERRYAGRIEAARQTDLAFEEGGTVQSILVDEGAQVAAGDIIATLDTRLLASSLEQQRATRAALVSQQDFARLTVERREALQDRGFTSAEAYDDARFSLARLTSEIAGVDAAIQSIEIRLEKAELRAPFAGTIGARRIDEGATAGAGVPVVTLLEDRAPQLRVGLPPETAAQLRRAQSFDIVVDERMVKATLTRIRPDLDTSTRTIPVLFSLEDAGALPFGEVGELVLPQTVAEPGYWLPITALQEGVRGLWTVLSVDADGRVAREAVEVLHVAGERTFVRGALPDAPILATGTHRVTPGQIVRPQAEG
ncbi:MAG: efflux RND transporter periplasmic adaptor subunit [Pseudomonadota bacterium]